MDTLKQLFGDSLVGKKKLTTRETTLTCLVTVGGTPMGFNGLVQ